MRLKRFFWITPTTVLLIGSQTFRVNFPVPLAAYPVVAQTSDARKAEAKRLFLQGGQQIGNSQFQAAIQSLQQALSIYREIKDRLGEGWTLRQIGYAYKSLKDYPKAIDYYQQSLVVALEIEDFGLEAMVRSSIEVAQSESNPRIAEADRLRNQGRQQYQTNQFEAALQSWQQALNIYRETKERQGEGLMLRDLGNAYDSLEDYPKAIEYHQQYLAVAREIKDRLSEGFALLYLNNSYANQGIQQFENSQFEAAIQSWQQALSIDQEIENGQDKGCIPQNLGLAAALIGKGEGWILGNIGAAYLKLGDSAKAIEYFQQTLPIARANGDPQSEGQVLGNLGSAYLNLGDYPKVIEYSQQSLAIARQIKDPQIEGRALLNLGAAYISLGDYPKGIEYSQHSLPIARQIQDPQSEGQVLGNLGFAYLNQGDYPKAIEYFQQHLVIARQIQDPQGEGRALLNLGDAYRNLGDYTKAIEYSQQSLAIARQIQDPQIEGRALGGIGLAYLNLGDYPKAIEYSQQHLAIARSIQERKSEGVALGNLGAAYLNLGDYPKAIDYFQQHLAIARAILDRQGEGVALGNLGAAYSKLQDYPKAIEYQQQVLAIARSIQDRQGEGIALGNIGVAYSELGDYPKATEYFQQIVAIARSIQDRQTEGVALNNLGYALYKQGNLALAESNLIEGIKVLESLRSGLKDNEKISIFETQRNIYVNLQEVLITQNKTNAALEIAERGRARAFVELLASRISSETETKSETLTINQLKQIAKKQKATLVEYSIINEKFKIQGKQELRNSKLYIWVIKPTGEVTFRKADLKPLWQQQNTSLEKLVTTTRDSIGVDDRSIFVAEVQHPVNEEEQTKSLQQLHQLLIVPIADLLPTDPNQRVIFVPQEELFLVPFPALQEQDGKYLIEKHTILTAPSIQVLELTRQQREKVKQSAVKDAIVVGNPTMPSVPPKIGEKPQQLASLKGAKREAETIAPLLNTKALTGNEATKAAVLARISGAKIVHFATHGLFDDFQGLQSAVALAPTSSDRGLLTAEEILNLKLNADLVVLSACNTGRGRITGDGVIGLSRSLFIAGTPSVLVSLWSVPDAPTAELMTEFYTNLYQKKLDKAQSLRQAMLKMMETHRDNPRAWAAFTLIGETE